MKTLIGIVLFISVNAFATDKITLSPTEKGKVFPRLERYEYNCTMTVTSKATGATEWKTDEVFSSGIEEEYHLDENNLIVSEQHDDGRSVTRIRTEKLSEEITQQTFDHQYKNKDGAVIFSSQAVQTFKFEKGLKVILSSTLNGVPSPVTRTKYRSQLGEKAMLYTAVHTDPGSLSDSTKEVSQHLIMCIYQML
jgi:hypothetical protein